MVFCNVVLWMFMSTNIAQEAPWIDTVHLVMSNHFDCGFDGIEKPGFAVNVLNQYFDTYFPNAVTYGAQLTRSNPNMTYTWMTQSWLISMFFDCPIGFGLHCPSQSRKDYIQKGIDKGYIYWHAFPFNSQLEVYDTSMLEFGLKLSRDLSIKHNTTISHILSQRDVPGLTRSIIPILSRNNITGVSIGVNGGSAPPDVPSIFRWNDPQSNQTIIGLWNAGGYGSVSNSPVFMNGFNEALVFAWKGDNAGPPTPTEAESFYNQTKQQFPNANILSSSITNFVNALLKNEKAVHTLPIIDAEIGDTWVHGVQSDPWKTSINRAAQRERTKCLQFGGCTYDSVAFYNFSRLLLKNGEHTWGGDIKRFLGYGQNGSAYYEWNNTQLQAALNVNNGSNAMSTFRATWYEQRKWGIYYPMEALAMSSVPADHTLYNNIMNEWNVISNVMSPLDSSTDWVQAKDATQMFKVRSSYSDDEYLIQFDTTNSGALKRLMNTNTGVNYASDKDLIGELIYATYTEQDFNDYIKAYTYDPDASFMPGDFGKSGLDENAQPEHHYISATFNSLYRMKNNQNIFLVQMDFGSKQSVLETKYGAPQHVFQRIDFDTNRATFTMDLFWINKTATRIPEDYFYRFNPRDCTDWKVQKFGEMIDIADVVVNGSMHMHATTGNVSCRLKLDDHVFGIESVDVALSSFMPSLRTEYSPFPVPFVRSSQVDGTAFVLYDNTWGTDYPVWFPFDENDCNTTYRFNILL
eukprot:297095_1